MVAVRKYSLTLNNEKCVVYLNTIRLFVYISKGTMKPDPKQLKHLNLSVLDKIYGHDLSLLPMDTFILWERSQY